MHELEIDISYWYQPTCLSTNNKNVFLNFYRPVYTVTALDT